jgi:glycosyltransferase involved in cell wall biosynthesis
MIIKRSDAPQIIVAQLGARMHYAVPVLLHRAGMLAQFYTDTYVGKGSPLRMFSQASHLLPEAWRSPMLKKLLGRREDGLPPEKVTAFNRFGWAYVRAQQQARNAAEREKVSLGYGRRFCELIEANGLKPAAAIYAFGSAALKLFQWANHNNQSKILEQIIAPMTIMAQLMREEHDLWPGWEESYPESSVWQPRSELEVQEWQKADAIVCGSDFVAQGLTSLGVPLEKIRVVPYGVEPSRFAASRAPYDSRRPLRVLFMGGVSLRKGPQYLVQALEKLNTPRVVARLVGPVVIREPYRRQWQPRLELTGQVSRSEVRHHYQWADVFVFPSICEGSATVTYEALAAGLPVITTPNAGSVVRDGIDGFIVPIRDAGAIAEKIDRLLANPALLTEMSLAARNGAQEFSWEKYGERLVTTVKELLGRADFPWPIISSSVF